MRAKRVKKNEEKKCFEEHGNQFTKEYRNDVQNIGKYRKNRRFFRIWDSDPKYRSYIGI